MRESTGNKRVCVFECVCACACVFECVFLPHPSFLAPETNILYTLIVIHHTPI